MQVSSEGKVGERRESNKFSKKFQAEVKCCRGLTEVFGRASSS